MCEEEFYVEDMHIVGINEFYVHNTCGFCGGGQTDVTVDIQLRECVQCQVIIIWIFDSCVTLQQPK